MDFIKLCVGERFEHDMPEEGMSIVLANGAPLLTFNFSVSPGEIQAFLNGTASFALFAEQNHLFFLFKIEGFLDWSDLAFTIHLAGDETIDVGEAYLPFNLVLIEPDTKIVKGLRMVTVSQEFRSRLAELIRKQASEPFDTMTYYRGIGGLYDKYPTASDLLKQAVIIEQGGKTLPITHTR
ncbi:MAG: hypothetical protein M0R33_24015 [Methylomonas sp.]|jgi:hypothetical protein|uniref:hypothetical protein n=1 Tax=Methylomonas sp. TaxID=418 RepID=UPI0025E1DB5F|nr:hypothetical protein [Methylomonas sp.]MCK9609506.1 hypothetical protein [Methylomonas sp.]